MIFFLAEVCWSELLVANKITDRCQWNYAEKDLWFGKQIGSKRAKPGQDMASGHASLGCPCWCGCPRILVTLQLHCRASLRDRSSSEDCWLCTLCSDYRSWRKALTSQASVTARYLLPGIRDRLPIPFTSVEIFARAEFFIIHPFSSLPGLSTPLPLNFLQQFLYHPTYTLLISSVYYLHFPARI